MTPWSSLASNGTHSLVSFLLTSPISCLFTLYGSVLTQQCWYEDITTYPAALSVSLPWLLVCIFLLVESQPAQRGMRNSEPPPPPRQILIPGGGLRIYMNTSHCHLTRSRRKYRTIDNPSIHSSQLHISPT
jgi:hypothetical protein